MRRSVYRMMNTIQKRSSELHICLAWRFTEDGVDDFFNNLKRPQHFASFIDQIVALHEMKPNSGVIQPENKARYIFGTILKVRSVK